MPEITITVQRAVRLSIAGSSTFSLIPGGNLTRSDFQAGFFDTPSALQVTVHANAAWRVHMRATGTNFSGTCAAKLAGAIKWGTSAAARTNVLTTVDALALSGNAGANQPFTIYLSTSLSWTGDAPTTEANCTLPVAFTASTP